MTSPAELGQPFRQLLEDENWVAYRSALETAALNWWFEVDVACLARHAGKVLPHSAPEDLSPGLAFFLAMIEPGVSLEQVEDFFQSFMEASQHQLAAAAAGGAIGLIYESGRELSRMKLWADRIASLLENGSSDLPPLSRSYLYSQKGLASLVSQGDPRAANREYLEAFREAQEADSPAMRLYTVGVAGLALCYAGNFAQCSIMVFDNAQLCALPGIPLMHRTMFRVMHTSLLICQGMEYADELRDLEEWVGTPDFDCLPPMTWFTILENLLHCYNWSGRNDKSEQVARRMMSLLVVDENYQYHSYLHLNMAIIATAMGDYETAIYRCQEAEHLAAKSQSLFVAMQPPYVMGRVLIESGKYDEAIELLEKCRKDCTDAGFRLIGYFASLEIAQARLAQGDLLRARKAFETAMEIIDNQDVTAPGRPLDFVSGLRRRLYLDSAPQSESSPPIRVEILGDLTVHLGEKTITGRNWRGRSTKTLLAAIIAKGCRQVSAAALMDMVWPMVEGDKAAQRLKTAAFRLRRVGLSDGQEPLPWLTVSDQKYTIDPALCSVDSLMFQDALKSAQSPKAGIDELAGALELYSGGFWEFEEEPLWIVAHRNRLKKKYIAGALTLARRCLAAGEAAKALPYLDKALAMDQLREDIYAALMEIHLQNSQPVRAARVFKAAEEALESSMGVKPGPVLTELARQAGV